MIEKIEMILPENILPFTGERLTTDLPQSQIEAEHLHRYLLARKFCADKRILDIACGEGYGSNILSQVAECVVGIDIDETTINHARNNYHRENLSFKTGDACNIPCSDGQFDVIVSFETIEHLTDHDSFLKELKRLINNDGLLIISSPDKNVYSGPTKNKNPFHLNELDKLSFIDIISQNFSHVYSFSQQAMIGSIIVPDKSNSEPPLIFEKVDPEFILCSDEMVNSPYTVIFAANKQVDTTKFSAYIQLSEFEFIIQDQKNYKESEKKNEQKILLLSEKLAQEEVISQDRFGAINHLEGVVKETEKQLRSRSELVTELISFYNEREIEFRSQIKILQQELIKLNSGSS
jgi:SAM-dependent methyltransferase